MSSNLLLTGASLTATTFPIRSAMSSSTIHLKPKNDDCAINDSNNNNNVNSNVDDDDDDEDYIDVKLRLS